MSSKLLLAISSGRNHVLKATLKLSGPPGVTFYFQASTLYRDGESQSVIITLLSIPCQMPWDLLNAQLIAFQYWIWLNILKFQY